jgi:hypothetical protein
MSQAGPRGPANAPKAPPAPAKAASPPTSPKAAPAASPPKVASPGASPPKAGPPAASPPAPPVAPREGVRPRLATAPGIGEGADTPPGPAVGSSDQVQAIVRTAVAEAVGAVLGETQRLIRQLEQRIEELERRPAGTTANAHGTPPAASSNWAQAYGPSAVAQVRVEAPAPVLDLAAIERSVHVDVDPALDGGRRRRRLFVVVTFFFIVVFGGLFAMLAQSYTPHH